MKIEGDTQTKQMSVELTEDEQREFIVYIWKYKPELIRDIICEECLEHIKCIEDENYRMAYGEKSHP